MNQSEKSDIMVMLSGFWRNEVGGKIILGTVQGKQKTACGA